MSVNDLLEKASNLSISELEDAISNSVLDTDTRIKFEVLGLKLKQETIQENERQLYLQIAEREAHLRNQRVAYMIKLSQLRKITFEELMEELGLPQIKKSDAYNKHH